MDNVLAEKLLKRHVFLGDDLKIGSGVQVWDFAYLSSNVVIGDNTIVGRNVYIGAGVKIGKNVKIQNNVLLYEGAIVGDGVFLGPNVVVTNDLYPRATIDNTLKKRKDWNLITTSISNNASLSANVVVVCGNRVGAFSLIGAASVVTRDVPDYSLSTGNPARHRGWVDQYGYPLQKHKENIWISRKDRKLFYERDGKIFDYH